MKNNDKILIAFLVSAGLFSLCQAKQYISNLSTQEKNSLMFVKKIPGQIFLAVGPGSSGDGGPAQDPSKRA